jgi:hypothetical protein
MVQKIGEAAESVRLATDVIRELAKILIDVMRSAKGGYSVEMK